MQALCILALGDAMPQTLTIRNVPDVLARKLKTRAERNHRSLQGEVMAILEQASLVNKVEQSAERYLATATAGQAKAEASDMPPRPAEGGSDRKLAIEELWDRGKRLGLAGPNESARIVRKLRDERHGR